jgi:hypothetical protein
MLLMKADSGWVAPREKQKSGEVCHLIIKGNVRFLHVEVPGKEFGQLVSAPAVRLITYSE